MKTTRRSFLATLAAIPVLSWLPWGKLRAPKDRVPTRVISNQKFENMTVEILPGDRYFECSFLDCEFVFPGERRIDFWYCLCQRCRFEPGFYQFAPGVIQFDGSFNMLSDCA